MMAIYWLYYDLGYHAKILCQSRKISVCRNHVRRKVAEVKEMAHTEIQKATPDQLEAILKAYFKT